MKSKLLLSLLILLSFIAKGQINTVKPSINKEFSARIYPNPAVSSCQIEFSGYQDNEITEIRIMNLLGSEVYKTTRSSSENIEINFIDAGMVNGIYLIKITHKGKTVIKRLVIQS